MSSHTCLYYESEKSLLELITYFFQQGLSTNRLCLWVVPQSMGIKGAKEALREKIKDLDAYIKKGQFEFLSHKDVYLRGGKFDPAVVLAYYAGREKDIVERGFSGLCVSGDASWMPKEDWAKMEAYEKEADKRISKGEIMALCTYPSQKFDVSHLFSLSFSHDLILKGDGGKMDVLIDKRDMFK